MPYLNNSNSYLPPRILPSYILAAIGPARFKSGSHYDMAMEIKLYLLELRGGKFYVGQASDPAFRFQEHVLGVGAKWTRLYKPIRIKKVETVEIAGANEAMLYENWMTLQAMERFGWANVRGGDFLVVEDYLLKLRIEYIYDCDANRIRYYIPKCSYLFGSTGDWLIYVLELRHGRYYVGSGKHLGKSLGQHFAGRGIDWTRVNPVIRVLEWMAIKSDSGKDYQEVKRQIVLEYVDRYGWKNVMGGERPPRW